jgi:hypothetical protein
MKTTLLYCFYALLIGVMLGYSWRMHHERIDTNAGYFQQYQKE